MEKLVKYWVAAVVAVALAYGAYIGVWAYRNIVADYPMEYRENEDLLTSALQLEGRNPYSLAERPVYVNLYGPGYFWASYPFARWFGNSYQTLRTVAVGFLLASCGLLVWGLRTDGCPWWAALSGGCCCSARSGRD